MTIFIFGWTIPLSAILYYYYKITLILIWLLLKCCIDACSSSTSSVDTSGKSGLFQRRHTVRQPNAIPDEVTWTAAFNPPNKALLKWHFAPVQWSGVMLKQLLFGVYFVRSQWRATSCDCNSPLNSLNCQISFKTSLSALQTCEGRHWACLVCCYLGLLTLHMGSVKPTV